MKSRITAWVQAGKKAFSPDFAALSCALILLNLPYLLRPVWPHNDARGNYDAFYFFYNELFQNGELPLWIPFGYWGAPSDLLRLAISPIAFVVIFLGKTFSAANTLFLYKFSLALEQWVMLLGMYRLSGRLFENRAAIFFVCLGTILSTVWIFPLFLNFRVYAMLPLAFYFLVLFHQTERPHFLWLAGIVFSIGNLGSSVYFLSLYSILALIFLAGTFLKSPRSCLRIFEPSLKNLLAFVAFLILAGTYLWIVWESMRHLSMTASGRDTETFRVPLGDFLHFGSDIGYVKFLGFAFPGPVIFIGKIGILGHTMYLGLLPFLFVLFALTKRQKSIFWIFFSITVFLFFFSLGYKSPFCAWLYQAYPPIRIFRHLGSMGGMFKPFVLILAGFGLDGYLQTRKSENNRRHFWSKRRWAVLFSAVACWILLFVAENLSHLYPVSWPFFQSFARALFSLCCLLLIFEWPRSTLKIGLVVCLFYAVDLGIYQKLAWNEFKTWTVDPKHMALAAPRKYSFIPIRTSARFQDPTAYRRDNWPSYSYVHNFTHTDTCINFNTRTDFMTDKTYPLYKNRAYYFNAKSFPWWSKTIGCLSPVLRLAGNCVFVESESSGVVNSLFFSGMLSGNDSDILLYDVPRESCDPAEPRTPNDRLGEVRVTRYTANRLETSVAVNRPEGAWLYWADSYHPEWTASVDGRETPIHLANTAFKAVHLTEGKHRVIFSFADGFRGKRLLSFFIVSLDVLWGCVLLFAIFFQFFRFPRIA
jgi:hypothetical protein